MAEYSPVAAVSASEQRFDKRRRSIGVFLGPSVAALVLAWPMPELTPEAHRLAAIVTLVVIWWITEAIPIPITAMLGAALAALLGVAAPTAAFAPFAEPIMFVFIGSFILSRGIVTQGVDRRIAAAVLSVPVIGRSRIATFAAIAGITMLVSAWMSNMVATATMLPVLLAILGDEGALPVTESRRMLIGLAYVASIGGMITPVGAAPNLITIGFLDSLADTRIDFLTWIAITTPIAVTMAAILLMLMRTGLTTAAPAGNASLATRGPWRPGQRNALIAFSVTVVLWLVPGIIGAIAPDAAVSAFLSERVDESVAAIIGVTVLFLLPVSWKRREFTIGWKEAARIDWGAILLLGGGFSLGRMMFDTGLAAHIAQSVIGISGTQSLWTLTALATLLGVILTEITSNTAATSMLAPVVISICTAAGVDPVAPTIGTCLGASLAFMLPISTPSNAIVYGTGRAPLGSMVRYGILMDCIGFVVIQIGLWILIPLIY